MKSGFDHLHLTPTLYFSPWAVSSLLTTWWQVKAFMTDASFRNSIRCLRLADSLTVFTATRVSPSPLTMSFAMPSYTMPKVPWPSSLRMVIFSLATSHSSSSYTVNTFPATCYNLCNFISWLIHFPSFTWWTSAFVVWLEAKDTVSHNQQWAFLTPSNSLSA